MSEQAGWQGASAVPSEPQVLGSNGSAPDAGPARRVSAESFKSLLARLKQPATIHTSIHVPALVVQTSPPIPAPPAVTPESDSAPEPVRAEVPVAEVPVANVNVAPAISLTHAPPILPPPEPLAPVAAPEEPELVATPPAPRRPLVDPELEYVMRHISAVPSNDERIRFLNEAAELSVADAVMASPPGELAEIEERYLESVRAAEEAAAVPVVVELPLDEIEQTIAPVEPAPVAMGSPEEIFVEATNVLPHLANLGEAEAGELARSLLDMMASVTNSGLPHERALAADTLLRIVPRLPLKPLILMADRLAIMDSPPHLLVAKLIRDPRIEVSGPLLENSMHITDQDLTSAIAEGQNPKRRMIARRRRLSREISDQLIATDDASVQLTLVRNANAEISHEGFQKLSRAAGHEQDLLAPLCTRNDLPAPFAFELFWVAPVQLRRYLLNRFLTDSETLTKILKITLATQGGEDSTEATFPPPDEVSNAVSMLSAGQNNGACEKLATLMNVSAATVAKIMADHQGEPLAILFKAAGCSRAEFADHLHILAFSIAQSKALDQKSEELQILFDTLSFNKARILLTYWDWATRKSGPYAPLH
jgi:Uncharacterised protein conserved in bacteria (DUF2336)